MEFCDYEREGDRTEEVGEYNERQKFHINSDC